MVAVNESTKPAQQTSLMTVPNQLTIARLVLSIAVFVTMSLSRETLALRYTVSLVLFIIAAGTDWADGYLARKYGWVSKLGRILDPFADKMIICGTYIFLLAVPDDSLRQLGLHAWMVVLIVGRELLVTALRSFLEQQGRDFSAAMSGKLKMLFQCIAAALCLGRLAWPEHWPEMPVPAWFDWALVVSLWGAVLLTAYSGVAYIRTATRMLRE